MNISYLTTYLAVVDSGSIAGAARVLSLAPTTIAQQMRALEKEVGCRLLARCGHTVKPTSAGYRILERARFVVREANDLCTVAATDELPPGPLRLGATHSALMGLVPAALKEWNRFHTNVDIFLRPGDSVPLVSEVAGGEIDAAIIVDPMFQLPKSCSWTLLRKEKLVLVAPADMKVENPLVALGKEDFIRFDRSFTVGKLVDVFLKQHGLNPRAQFELDGIDVITNFVAAGLGVSILPECPHVLKRGDTKCWPLPAPCPIRKVGFLWLRSSVRAPLAMAFEEILLKNAVCHLDLENPD